MAPKYTEMQKVIWYKKGYFSEPNLVTAWISRSVYGPYVTKDLGRITYKVTEYECEAEQGMGQFVHENHLQPFSQEIWDAIEKLKKQEKEIKKQYEQLAKGKIPENLFQGGMF